VGLLIARLTVGGLLLKIGIANLLLGNASVGSFSVTILALLVCCGLFTTVVSTLAAILTITLLFFIHSETLIESVATTCFCIMLALIGAGAYSVDARLFGQRRVIWPRSTASPHDRV